MATHADRASPARERLSPGPSYGHYCQIHQQDAALVQAVVKFLAAGVGDGANLVVITRKKREQQILEWLAAKLPATVHLEEEGRLFIRSSTGVLDAVMVDGMPDGEIFQALATDLLRDAGASGRPVYLYGDAVSELWQAGRHAAAIALEMQWNRVLRDVPDVKVFCGYVIDALSLHSYSEHLQQLGREHSIIVAGHDQVNLQCALDEACREILGHSLSSEVQGVEVAEDDWRTRIPMPMRSTLWLMENVQLHASLVLQRARQLYALNEKHR